MTTFCNQPSVLVAARQGVGIRDHRRSKTGIAMKSKYGLWRRLSPAARTRSAMSAHRTNVLTVRSAPHQPFPHAGHFLANANGLFLERFALDH